ncbi:MAG: hypothetical protein FJW30_14285 [Acidobacteria bacterium]|nr:hypothetical protein [Acidobacteriota bacterium]
MKPLLLLAAMAAAAWAQSGKLIWTKSFPGSTPAWVRITIEPNGQGQYIEEPNDPQPYAFKLTESEVKTMYGLAEKLGWFNRNVESGLPVAKMGEKTFRYEDGAKASEQKFNYSIDPDAQALADWFERITESERYLMELERSGRFDKLGVNKVILQIHAAWDRKRLVAVEQYLKWLDRIARNESYLNMARERAALLADQFRNPAPAEAPKQQ